MKKAFVNLCDFVSRGFYEDRTENAHSSVF